VRFYPHGAFEGARLGSPGIRGLCLLDYRVRHPAGRDAGGAGAVEGVAARALRLPFTGPDGCDCNARRESLRGSQGLIATIAVGWAIRAFYARLRGLCGAPVQTEPQSRSTARAPCPRVRFVFTLATPTRNHPPQSVSCLSSMEKTAPAFT